MARCIELNSPLVCLLLVSATAGACGEAPPSGPLETFWAAEAHEPGDAEGGWFRDVTARVGIDFDHEVGALPGEGDEYFLPQLMGSGGAVLDFDGDGLLDVYLLHNGGPESPATNRLYRQGPAGRFRDVSEGSGLDVAGYGMGVAVGDVTNDGLPDVVVAEYETTRLFVNAGDGTFRQRGSGAGVENSLWGLSACMLDYDRDGWLDLAVANYLDHDGSVECIREGRPDYCGPQHYPGQAAKLFHNLGESGGEPGRFEDVTDPAGLGQLPGPGLGIACADLTGDRWPDVLVANDHYANHLWVNQGDGTFREEGLERGIAYDRSGTVKGNMGIALGDINGDAETDVFITHLAVETHTAWRSNSEGLFQDVSPATGLDRPMWQSTGFGTVLGDFDNDGDRDVAIVNGGVIRRGDQADPEGPLFWDPYRQRDQLLENDGSGRFRDVSEENPVFSGHAAVSRGLVWGDFGSDGGLDLLVTSTDGPAGLYRNVAQNRGHWLVVRCVDPALGGRDMLGAEVLVTAGGRTWSGLLGPGQSYVVSGDPRVHFGLGAASRVDSIRVIWPDGSEQVFPGVEADRVVVLAKR